MIRISPPIAIYATTFTFTPMRWIGYDDWHTCVTINVCDVPNLMDAKRIMML